MASMTAGDIIWTIGAMMASGAAEIAAASSFPRGLGRRMGAKGAADNAFTAIEERRRAEREVDAVLRRVEPAPPLPSAGRDPVSA